MSDFKNLISTIEQLHLKLQQSAVNAVNQMLTIRNWLIGFYIVEFEQNGKDRAEYGERLIECMVEELKSIKGIDRRSLFRFRQFYLFYPQFSEAIHRSLSSDLTLDITFKPWKQKVGTLSPQFKSGLVVPGE